MTLNTATNLFLISFFVFLASTVATIISGIYLEGIEPENHWEHIITTAGICTSITGMFAAGGYIAIHNPR